MCMGRHIYLPSGYIKRNQAPVVQKVDSTIHWVNRYPVVSAFGFNSLISIHKMVIYPMDGTIQLLNNLVQK